MKTIFIHFKTISPVTARKEEIFTDVIGKFEPSGDAACQPVTGLVVVYSYLYVSGEYQYIKPVWIYGILG